MNKETRTFIFGLLLMISSAYSIAYCVYDMKNNNFGGLDWAILPISIITGLMGVNKVGRTTS